MRTSERARIRRGGRDREKAAAVLLFSSLLLLERTPPLSHRVQPSPLRGTCTAGPRGAIFRTKRALIRAFIVRVSFLPLSTFLPRNARTRVCLSASRAESSPPFVRIRKSSTVERLSSSSWMEIGIPLPLCTSQDSIVGNSKWRNRVTKRNRIWVIWTKDYITRLLSL